MKKFYDGFKIEDFDLNLGRMTILWDDAERIIDIHDIADIINIPITYRNNDQLQIVEYASIMGPRCGTPPG